MVAWANVMTSLLTNRAAVAQPEAFAKNAEIRTTIASPGSPKIAITG